MWKWALWPDELGELICVFMTCCDVWYWAAVRRLDLENSQGKRGWCQFSILGFTKQRILGSKERRRERRRKKSKLLKGN